MITEDYKIGYAHPPIHNKYNFALIADGAEAIVKGDYRLIRIATYAYNKRNNVRLIAIKVKGGALVKKTV